MAHSGLAISGIGAAQSSQPAQMSQSTGQHRHGGHSHSISDVDAQSSSVASAAKSTGRVGSKLNVTV
ncbi:MAG: hypothetical protein ABSE22_08685 [Xanthobacteraceae bacterium]